MSCSSHILIDRMCLCVFCYCLIYFQCLRSNGTVNVLIFRILAEIFFFAFLGWGLSDWKN